MYYLFCRSRDARTATAQPKFRVEQDLEISSQYPIDLDDLGSWVMEFNRAWLEQFWERARKLYLDQELPGVVFLKAMTAQPERRTGKIAFFAGPREDEKLMKECGRILSEKMKYFNQCGIMEYTIKKDFSTVATISIPVPTQLCRR